MRRFTLHMQIPSGKNAIKITRTGMRYPSKKFVAWRAAALAAIGPVTHPYLGRLSLTVRYTPGDRIRRDAPGMIDALCHVLEKSGMVQDDAQIKEVEWCEYPVNKGKPCCEVLIIPRES